MADSSLPGAPGDVTRLLYRLRAGEPDALDLLFPLVYDELRVAARRALHREGAGRALQATELVHEAYLKLAGPLGVAWQDRAHFLAVASRAMRQILVDQARRRAAGKRGAGAAHVTLGEGHAEHDTDAGELIALDDALERLGARQPRLRTVVECRFFGGLTERETAEVLGVTERTVQRDWVRARAWLHKEMYPVVGDA